MGLELLRLHTLEKRPKSPARYLGQGGDRVERVDYQEADLWEEGAVIINQSQRFEGVPREAWEWQVGGYRPLEKYLEDRRGRVLSWGEIEHYRLMVGVALETLRLMEELDEMGLV
ncbi:hypothetical protein THFILI_11690 [Thermus filiformis]|uniref:Type ISP restriction-modification enzyme LLaBIII C-terminal specificity domain-containing protein n=1 Tax=Thermus filiformis TaxID=276 RepID=A0A0A2WQ85_THEFI|nr:hypothetical protein THFILI_11690 [Thermus filiformis]